MKANNKNSLTVYQELESMIMDWREAEKTAGTLTRKILKNFFVKKRKIINKKTNKNGKH